MNLPICKYRRASGYAAFLALLLLLCRNIAIGQSTQAGVFGCSGRTDFFESPGLPFEQLTDADAITKWKTRPSETFGGLDEKRYGFSKIILYRWRISLKPGSKDADPVDQTEIGDATNRLTLAVRLLGVKGDRWFELGDVPAGQNYPSDDLLTIQPRQQEDEPAAQLDQSEGQKQKSPPDEMDKWISITPATSDPSLPLFVLSFEYHNTGANAGGTMGNQLMLDICGGTPQIVKAAECIEWDGGGACTAPDTANAVYDNLSCSWERPSTDFHCTMVGPFGGDYAARVAEKDFYLLSNKPAKASWQKDDTPADLAALALRLNRDPKATAKAIIVPELGPVSLLVRYHDLLPGSEVFLFASPAAGPALSTHFSLVVVPDHGQPVVQNVSKWVISGEEADEVTSPSWPKLSASKLVYTPSASATPERAQAGYFERIRDDEYYVRPLEERQGFHALQVVLNSGAAATPSLQGGAGIHIIYWVGMEAVNGKLVTGAVRLASEGSTYAHCGQDLHDGSAISLRQKPGVAEANVTVRPQDVDLNLPDDAEKQNQCIWNGVLRWKSGSGFRVRRISQDCKQTIPDVSIADDGTITKKPTQVGEQTR